MTEIINLKNSQIVIQLKNQVRGKERELQKLQKRLEDANQRIGKLASTNELLKLALIDIRVKLQAGQQHIVGINKFIINFDNNIAALHSNLPDMSKFVRKTESQIIRELEAEKGKSTIIDITKKDEEED